MHSSQTDNFDSKWALPFEVIAMIAEAALDRNRRDCAGPIASPDPYLIHPLLSTSKPLKSHLLPLLYKDITIYTHRQLLSFLRTDPKCIDLVSRFTLEVDFVQPPMIGCFRTREGSAKERETDRLHRIAGEERSSLKAAVEAMRKRQESFERLDGASPQVNKDSKVLIVNRTSAASLTVAECFRFPNLELLNYHHPRTLYFGHHVTVLEDSLLPWVTSLKLRSSIPWLWGLLANIGRGLEAANKDLPLQKLAVEIVAPTDSEDLAALRRCNELLELMHESSVGLRVTVAVVKAPEGGTADSKERHLFCEGQPGEMYKASGKWIVYEACQDGSCVF